MNINSKEHSRYPYTYACEYLRVKIQSSSYDGKLISRSEASAARKTIADAMGLDDRSVAEALADKFIEENEIDFSSLSSSFNKYF